VVCRATERSSVYCYLSMTPQPSAYKKLYFIVTKQLPSKAIYGIPAVENNVSLHGGVAITHSHGSARVF